MSIDLDFIFEWTLDSSLGPVSCNQVAGKLSSDPFGGLLEADKNKLRDFIKSGSAENLHLPWITTNSESSLWFKWWVKKSEDSIHLYAIDISDLKNNEQYLSQILDSITDLILVKGEGSKIKWANKSFQEYYNISNEELKELIDAPIVDPDFTKQYMIDDKKVWDSKKPLLIECESVVRHDGMIRKFQTLKTPVIGPNDKVIFTVGVCRDITEKIELEEKTFTAAKMAAIGEMSGGLAHEINNPIAVIAGKVYLLKRALTRPKEVSKEAIINSLDTIENHVERITNVIKTLRKLSVDDDFEDFKSLNLSALVKDTLLMCETNIKEKGIDLVSDIPIDLFVEVRPIQFAKALLNLLHNSIEAIEDSSERWIKITAHARGSVFELSISDSGPGVSDEIIGKIMQPFFTTKDVGRGSGLGLSFALSVAKNHQGSLRLDKDISPSSFIFKFPLKQS